MILPKSFYLRQDVVLIAKELIGKYIFTHFDGGITGGIITETEAYAGITDRASHACGNRRTARTEVMYATGGIAYIYLCYGVHSLFNIVTNVKDRPHAVLLRGIYPTDGLDLMKRRIKKAEMKPEFGTGPGNAAKLLGIHYLQSGTDLSGDQIWIEDRGVDLSDYILTGPRIGVDYAGEDALLPYRFRVPLENLRK